MSRWSQEMRDAMKASISEIWEEHKDILEASATKAAKKEVNIDAPRVKREKNTKSDATLNAEIEEAIEETLPESEE